MRNITPITEEREKLKLSGFFNKGKYAIVGNDWEESRDDFVGGPPFEKIGQSSIVYGSDLKEIIEKQNDLAKEIIILRKDIFVKLDKVFSCLKLVMDKLGVAASDKVWLFSCDFFKIFQCYILIIF